MNKLSLCGFCGKWVFCCCCFIAVKRHYLDQQSKDVWFEADSKHTWILYVRVFGCFVGGEVVIVALVTSTPRTLIMSVILHTMIVSQDTGEVLLLGLERWKRCQDRVSLTPMLGLPNTSFFPKKKNYPAVPARFVLYFLQYLKYRRALSLEL